jgi:hypothetical protein
MKRIITIIAGFMTAALLSGCATYAKRTSDSSFMCTAAGIDSEKARPDRMQIWKANLNIEVWNISNAVSQASSMAERASGFIEQKSDRGEESASLTLRIPAKAFKPALSDLETLGTVSYRNVEVEDATEQYIDVDARLKNKIVLRDRLKQLLEKATEVKDILSIETELSRVQADIDSMEGRIKSLKGQVEYAMVRLNLNRKTILGPLGYLFKGVWWGLEKLFVVRE